MRATSEFKTVLEITECHQRQFKAMVSAPLHLAS